MKMKKILQIVLTSVVIMMLGCSANNSKVLDKKVSKEIKEMKVYREATTEKTFSRDRREAFSLSRRNIAVGFYKKSVSNAVRDVAHMTSVDFDESFIPSNKYKISIEFNGKVSDFLKKVYLQTGVKYKYRDGLLQVTNKNLIEEDIAKNKCFVGEEPKIKISLINASPMKILKYFSDEFGFNFIFQTKFNQLNGNQIGNLGSTSFFYSGCDAKEALSLFLKSIDFTSEERERNRFIIRDYKLATLNIPTYFDYEYKSGQTLGNESDGGSSSSGAIVNIKENGVEKLESFLRKFMSDYGRLNISNRGYLTILDKPSKVEQIKNIIATEIKKQTPIELSISILRVTMNDDVKTATDLSLGLSKILASDPATNFIKTGEFAKDIATGITFSANSKADSTGMVFQALQDLGTTKVVKEYNVKTRSGILNSFRAVDKIPYVTTTTLASSATTQNTTEAKFATSGIILNILPQLSEHMERISLATDILISEYLGDKTFNTGAGEVKLPLLSENEVQVPVQLQIGETAILTGFNLKTTSDTKSGVPSLINSNLIPDANRLFGSDSSENKASQLVIVVKATIIEDF